ncbi:MAG: apolipoprotein N-acyltransferase [Alkalispirochaeta sp.]
MVAASFAPVRPRIVRQIQTVGLLLLGAVLFWVSFPNVVFRFGAYPVAFVALIPVVVAIRRMPWWATPFYGALYGFTAYALFNYWLATFHPLAIFIVPVIYAGYFFVVFPMLRLADGLFGRWAFLVQICVWMAYEWFRTQAYLGYSYGIMGYALFPAPALIQAADIGGVWIISFLVILPSFLIGQIINDHQIQVFASWRRLKAVLTWRLPELVGYAVLITAAVVYGAFATVDYSRSPTWRLALVQQNIDPWIGGFRAYERSLEVLIRESDRALQEADPDAVIWSETSFVPSINYHTRYRTDQKRYALVQELMEYLERQEVPFVIGNSDGQLRRGADGELRRVDYNAVLTFEAGGVLQGTYRKLHLVPFTEHFPYEDQLPWLHQLLVENNTNFWEEGSEWSVFELNGVKFSTPICFEDTFGYLSRGFVREGAEVIVNLTNDLWSYSEPSAMQHMGMAVFRAVENRRSVVRSTNGGMTTMIDPNGALLDLYPPFQEGYLAGDVPVYTEASTVYTAWGDWLAIVFVISAGASLLLGTVRRITRRRGS